MSTREKAIGMLQKMPEQMVETIYAFMQSVSENPANEPAASTDTAFGIAHKYADVALIEKEKGAFARAMVEKYAAD